MQEWSEEPKTLINDPWLSIWKSPRETMREILDIDPNKHVLLLSALAGFVEALDWATNIDLGDSWPLIVVLMICALVGIVGGLLFVHLGAVLFRWTGRLFGGKASFTETRAAIAWSSIPIIWTLLIWVPAIALFGNKLFQSAGIELQDNILNFLLVPAIAIIAIAAIVFAIWVLYIFCNCLAEVS